MTTPILFILAFLHFINDTWIQPSPILDQQYRAAKYSMVLDFTAESM